ncbi:MAG: nuclear transport factor 2 family protein, partial [Pyrinomonadaceae bacterium]
SWSARPKRPGLLSWYPIFANVSSAGDMGYTTGPWEFRRESADEKPVAYGNFVSVWKKQANGVWRVALDIGTENEAPAVAPANQVDGGSTQAKIGKPRLKAEVDDERNALLNLDREFAKASVSEGAAKAFSSYAADDLRLHREGQFPVKGKEAALAVLSAKPERLSWQPLRADVSRSGDLGYTYGTYELGGNGTDVGAQETGNYLHIWKQQEGGKWKVVLDLLNPIPAKQ